MTRFIDIHTHNFTDRHIELHAVGIHPWEAENFTLSHICEAMFSNAEAIGEIGLDYACNVDKSKQEELFCQQLKIAEKLQKPIILHCVKSFESIMNLLLKYKLKAVVFHGFIGSKEQALQALKRGYFLSFGHRTFCSSKTIEALRSTPLSQLFVESDESDIPIEEIYAKIADLRCVSIDELKEATNHNYNKIFGLQNNE